MMEEDHYGSSPQETHKALSQRGNWLKGYSQAFSSCKFQKVKSILDSAQVSKLLISQMKILYDAEKMFLQMRFHAPQNRLLFFHSSKEPSTAAVLQTIKQACKHPSQSLQDVDVLSDIACYAECRLAFISFLTSIAEDSSTKSIHDALKRLSVQASMAVSASPNMSPLFERLRIEFKYMYHTFETLTFVNNLCFLEALIALQQAFARLDDLDLRTGVVQSGNAPVVPVSSGAVGDSCQRFHYWLRTTLTHIVGKFCAYFYTALNPNLISETQAIPNALPGLLARSSYPDFIGRFYTLAKKFSVEMLVLICDPVGDRKIIEPTFKLDIDSPHFVPSGDLHVLLSYWPSDPTNDPKSAVFSSAFNRCQHFILKLLTQHRVRDDLVTSAEVQSVKTLLTSVDSTVFLVCSYGNVARGQKDGQVVSAVLELASVLRCKYVFQSLKDACLH